MPNLGHLEHDEGVPLVRAESVEAREDACGLAFASLGDKPSWALGDEPNAGKLGKRSKCLYERGDSAISILVDWSLRISRENGLPPRP